MGYGHPGSSGQAQSGGINKTFGGGKGGTAASKKATNERKVGRGTLNNGLNYNIRKEAGDNAPVGQTGKIGSPPPLRGGPPKQAKVNVRKPTRKGSS